MNHPTPPQATTAMDPPHQPDKPTPTKPAPTTETHPQPDSPSVEPPAQPAVSNPAPDLSGTTQPASAAPAPATALALNPKPSGTAKPATWLLGFLGTAVIALVGLMGAFTINGFTRLDDRITQLDAKFETRFAQIDARFAAQDAKFDARFAVQDDKLDEINLKLTALIAALNATAEVEAALEGRLLDL